MVSAQALDKTKHSLVSNAMSVKMSSSVALNVRHTVKTHRLLIQYSVVDICVEEL
jgi:hypothetical protein